MPAQTRKAWDYRSIEDTCPCTVRVTSDMTRCPYIKLRRNFQILIIFFLPRMADAPDHFLANQTREPNKTQLRVIEPFINLFNLISTWIYLVLRW